ncbi:lysophospholipid acyltransferase family protein [Gordonia jinhuaensis]|uniref:1-acyl-sn-glycerol-3-phosphate acyltransferase n=1 Tax=Gordonia jinhuaensis TaxID=1517702 RepID=A0A916T0K7_9ACTN|nr:lysophospholipid acyltransferase family protein [Gordonia jinhuaensis]GGB23115.1 1-acyl-sn-glycerol-3-phosphate acyltransferase [Gordonia jinhuaensis]
MGVTDPVQRVTGSGLPTHSWYPVSVCDAGCVHPEIAVGAAVRAGRIVCAVAVVVWAAVMMPVVVMSPRSIRQRYVRTLCRLLLRALGVRLEVSDQRVGRAPGRRSRMSGPPSALVVANHTSCLDIPAIAAVLPSRFVTKSELCHRPVVAAIAGRVRAIPIMRRSLRDLPAVVDLIGEGIAAGDHVCVFPEGTTHCGRHVGDFHPAVFQAAVDAQTPVQPVRLEFSICGRPTTHASFIGDDGIGDTLGRVLRTQGLMVRVVLLDMQAPGDDRRELSRRCEALIHPVHTGAAAAGSTAALSLAG